MKKNWTKEYSKVRGVEPPTGNTIGNLNPKIPLSDNLISQGDDHIRATKRALQGSFPVIGDAHVNLSAQKINHIHARFKVGMMMYFDDRISAIPAGWAPCDGNNYNGFQTVDLAGYFIKADGEEVIGSIGGFEEHTPKPAEVKLTEAQTPSHSHTASITLNKTGDEVDPNGSGGGYGLVAETGNHVTSSVWGGSDGATADEHTHPIETFNNQPAYMTMMMIVFVGIA